MKCHSCDNEAVDGKKRCLACLKHSAEKTMAAQQRRRAKGLCYYSGCPRKPSKGHVYCRTHLKTLRETGKARSEKRKKQGVCRQCAGPLTEGRTAVCVRCQPAPVRGTYHEQRKARLAKAQAAMIARQELCDKRQAILSQRSLSPRTEFIIRKRWGMTSTGKNVKKWSLQEIGDVLGLSRERVRQIEEDTLTDHDFREKHRARRAIYRARRRGGPPAASTKRLSPIILSGALVLEACGDILVSFTNEV